MQDILSLFLGYLGNFIVWFILILITRIIIKKIKKQNKPILKSTIFVSLVIALVAVIPKTTYYCQRLPQTKSYKIDDLSFIEKNRIREIITLTMQNTEYLNDEIRNEFWGILEKNCSISESSIQGLREAITGVSNIYMRYFYEDALWALESGRPFKSSQREEYESNLLKQNLLTDWRIKENENMIAKIAMRKPIQFSDSEIIFSSDIIQDILTSLENTSKNLDLLFTRPSY